MPSPYCVDDFKDKFDSLYRLVIVASARSIQLAKSESRGFGSSLRSQKSTVKALEEVLNGQLSYVESGEEDTDFLENEE